MAASPVTMPIGTLMKSTHRHESSDVSIPPSSTPIAPPAPPTAPHSPSAFASFGPENVVTMIVKVVGERAAPPIPCTARAAVSHPEFSANPPMRLVPAKTKSPIRNIRLPPEGIGGPST